MEQEKVEKVKKPFYKKVWFWVVILFVISYFIGNNQLENVKTTKPTAEQIKQEAVVEAIKVSATKLSEDYRANEISADAKYKNKIVEVSGLVDAIGNDITDTPFIVLQTKQYSIIDRVQCMFSKSDLEALAKVSKDQQITLRGEVSGLMGNVLIKGCQIMK